MKKTFEDLNIGKFYTRWDDAIYKVIDKGDDWYLTLKYSNNHHVFNPIIHSKDELLEDYNINHLEEIKDDVWYYEDLFNNAKYYSDFTLIENDET